MTDINTKIFQVVRGTSENRNETILPQILTILFEAKIIDFETYNRAPNEIEEQSAQEQIEELEDRVNSLEDEVSELESDIESVRDERDAFEAELEELKEEPEEETKTEVKE